MCSVGAVNNNEEYESESYDGWYNNKAHPDWGGAGKLKVDHMVTVFTRIGTTLNNKYTVTTGHRHNLNRCVFFVSLLLNCGTQQRNLPASI